MKPSNLVLIAMTLTFGTLARAEYVVPWDEIQDLQNAGNTEQAFLLAARMIDTIHDDLKIGEVVSEVETRMTEIRKEKITERLDLGLDLKLLFLSVSARSRTNVTKILTQNPEEVSAFPLRVRRELKSLQRDLRNYVRAHAVELVALKHLGLKAMEIVLLSRPNTWLPPQELIEGVLAKVLDLQFLGEQTVTTCVETTYARRTERQSGALSLDLLFMNLGYARGESVKRWYRHMETACSSSVNEVNVSNTEVLRLDLTSLDHTLARMGQVAYAKVIYAVDPERFPIFGNPYYR